MKQILQHLRGGTTTLTDVPRPISGKNTLIIKSSRSLVSLGSERMLVEFGRAGWLAKARQQPEKVKQVLDKMRTDGVMPTLEAVFHKLDEPMPLGYCNAGVVEQVGEGISDIRPGDRVVSNGSHAEFVCVPRNLVAKIPEGVSDDEAAFTVIGSIALQGIRLTKPELGERVVVIGLGLVGLITAALLRVHGCVVIGYDMDPAKVEVARGQGIDAFVVGKETDTVAEVLRRTGGVGADAVLITASAKTNQIVSDAARMSRKRGRIILVGVVGLELNRSEFYEKELTFQVSCSYGPGRYDENYEWRGQDYPLGYVRWTENRNFQAILEMMADKRLDVRPFISEVVPLERAPTIYANMGSGKIASLISYGGQPDTATRVTVRGGKAAGNIEALALIGAGNFTRMALLPALKKGGVVPRMIVSRQGVSGTTLAQKYGIAESSTRYEDVLEDAQTRAVIITTRHDQHAPMALQALKADKHVFVEKPLCLNWGELREIVDFYSDVRDAGLKSEIGDLRAEPVTRNQAQEKPTLTVGYNRRFSPFVRKMKALLGPEPGPMSLVLTMNAGFIPTDSWVHNLKTGGGRILGEACHYIDLAIFLSGSRVREVVLSGMGVNTGPATDTATLTLKMENGSLATIHYFANGHKSFSKERIEVFSQGRVLHLDNFKKLYGYGFKGFSRMSGRQDKGHQNQFAQYCAWLKAGGEPLIPLEEIINSTAASLAALDSIGSGEWVSPMDRLTEVGARSSASGTLRTV